MAKNNKCESCGKKNNSYYNQFFEKNICYNCEENYCCRCQRELKFTDNDKKKIDEMLGTENSDEYIFYTKCELCGGKSCYECMCSDCDICNNTYDRCSNCYGSTIKLGNDYDCCVSCLLFRESGNGKIIDLKYCEEHKKYFYCDSDDEDCVTNDNCKFVNIEPDINDYIEKNKDEFFPPLNKYALWMINNPGYRGPDFM